ncbi:MAG: GIY-YIG nuclease family protein [Candidatus Eisenbacteria bacterium]|nr:GIY-YIG nuclease family protein [Candidatus Eisenbacteria bacterium]
MSVARSGGARGYVYLLTSPNSDCVKVGGTAALPLKRIREVNATEPYRSLGPWSLEDCREVHDWRAVERHMHYTFRGKLARRPLGQRELFRAAPVVVREQLSALDPSLILRKPRVDRMFQDEEFAWFRMRLFRFTGILTWSDIQGAWTFTLFTQTGRGRYYTINIGPHEVAYATLPGRFGLEPYHAIVMDKLIREFPKVTTWLKRHRGRILSRPYATALPRSVSVGFVGSFESAHEFLSLDGVRRALVAYWSESLIRLQEREVGSMFARYHDWNPVSELRNRLRSEPRER